MPMIQKIAVSVFGNRVSSRLDCSESVLLVSIDDKAIVQRQEMRWTHLNALEKIPFLHQEGVTLLICGGLTETCANLFQESGIQVASWVRGEVEEVLLQFLQGRLRTDASPQGKTISS
jgi:predicted Fe-Mo cluster-binding NifX family protein